MNDDEDPRPSRTRDDVIRHVIDARSREIGSTCVRELSSAVKRTGRDQGAAELERIAERDASNSKLHVIRSDVRRRHRSRHWDALARVESLSTRTYVKKHESFPRDMIVAFITIE